MGRRFYHFCVCIRVLVVPFGTPRQPEEVPRGRRRPRKGSQESSTKVQETTQRFFKLWHAASVQVDDHRWSVLEQHSFYEIFGFVVFLMCF